MQQVDVTVGETRVEFREHKSPLESLENSIRPSLRLFSFRVNLEH